MEISGVNRFITINYSGKMLNNIQSRAQCYKNKTVVNYHRNYHNICINQCNKAQFNLKWR